MKNGKEKIYFYLFLIFLSALVLVYEHTSISFYQTCRKYKPENVMDFREMNLTEDMIVLFQSQKQNKQTKILKRAVGDTWYSYYKTVLQDIKYFPVAEDVMGKERVGFENGWLSGRTYGGKRFHEGTDIMTSNNKRNYFKIVSMTDGVIEKKGWLEKGGYRLGIRSASGGYYYYAHLAQYAPNLEEGDLVKAGQFIAMMGDSGYSKVEGTVGNFDVHLHIGIYLDIEGIEVSVNPYWLLLYLKDKTIALP